MVEINRMGVIGAGQMGSGIAQLAALNGVDVWLHDSDVEALTRARNSISKNIERQVSKGHLTQVFYLVSVLFLNTFIFVFVYLFIFLKISFVFMVDKDMEGEK